MPKELRILVAEDEESDLLLLRHALRRAGLPHQLIVAQDGKEVVDYLSGETATKNMAQRPALVLLDLKMPRMSGFELLAWLQNNSDLKELPAVVLTSSDEEVDRQRAHQLGATAYLVKPPSLEGLVEVVRWLQLHFGEAD